MLAIACSINMAANRLSDSQKSELVESYRIGVTTAELAENYQCSSNTVSRILKQLLPAEEYSELKGKRAKRVLRANKPSIQDSSLSEGLKDGEIDSDKVQQGGIRESSLDSIYSNTSEVIDSNDERNGPLALDDADDFGEDLEEVHPEDDIFQEIVPLVILGVPQHLEFFLMVMMYI